MPSLGAGRWSWSTSRACTLGIRGCSNSASLHPASLSLWSRASSHPIAFSRTGQQPIGGGRRGWRNRFARHKSEELGCPCPQKQKFEAVHSLALWVAKCSAPIRLFRVCFCCWSLLSHVFNSTVDIRSHCVVCLFLFGPSVVGIRSVLAPTLIQEGESVNHSMRFTQRQDLQRYRNGLEVHVHSV